MSPSRHVRVLVDLARIARNAQAIRRSTGVALIAIIKADAYGLGADRVAPALADVVDEFAVFSAEEAKTIDLWNRTGKPALAIGPPQWDEAAEYRSHHLRPAVSNVEQARKLKSAFPVLCLDTGQQRFACPIDQADKVLREGDINEAFTHASRIDQVRMFKDALGGKVSRLHAAGSSLLHDPAAWLDAVRPGLALYRGAVRVMARLIETHRGTGPAGYSGFVAPHHGVILAGYSNGLHPGPCLVNGRPSRILEVGMQSAFVQTDPADKVGDEVTLLGDTLTEDAIGTAWNCGPHEALLRLASAGIREYIE